MPVGKSIPRWFASPFTLMTATAVATFELAPTIQVSFAPSVVPVLPMSGTDGEVALFEACAVPLVITAPSAVCMAAATSGVTDCVHVDLGTGISLPQYGSHLRIFGTDISEAMLQKAKKRVDELKLKNVEGLAVMDAEKLEFPDDSFDVVMAQYVVTAVPNPEKALDEFARVLRPGGELIILTRVSADAGMRRFIEQRLQPVVRPLGFCTAEFAWSRYAQWLANARGIELAERRLVPPLGHFSLVRFRKTGIAAAA